MNEITLYRIYLNTLNLDISVEEPKTYLLRGIRLHILEARDLMITDTLLTLQDPVKSPDGYRALALEEEIPFVKWLLLKHAKKDIISRLTDHNHMVSLLNQRLIDINNLLNHEL